MHGLEEPWLWADENSNISCPQAPDPQDPPVAPTPEQDVWPESRWAQFLDDWHTSYREQPVTAAALVANGHVRLHLPRTAYGDAHAIHLEEWLGQRADTSIGRYTIRRRDITEGESARWLVLSTEDATGT
ncbi:hypothetical protein [Streptomyces sp. NPDC059743]|uniref:hypothetical protein n=1 Tax=Streptomyces sp. NPDC059743 TaxID=3346928 RepID=UPI00364686AA